MKIFIKNTAALFILLITISLFVTSCQDEEMIIENPPPEESVVANSTISNAMRTMATNEIEIINNTIDCIDFIYPISFSIYNPEFIIIDTAVINNAQELLVFLATLGVNNNQIVSLNYPVSLEKENGDILEATNNVELLNIIVTALMECDAIVNPMNECPELLIDTYLQECFWYPKVYDGTSVYEFNHFTFINDSVYRMSAFAFNVEEKYDTYDVGDRTFIEFRANQVPILDFITGTWQVQECAENELALVNVENDIALIFAQDCGTNQANCFGSGQGICDDNLDGFVVVDFNEIINQANCPGLEDYSITFHLTLPDAETQTNALPSPFTTTVPFTQTFYYAIVDNATGILSYVSLYQIDAEDCGGCANPGVLTDDLIVYMPFGGESRELISNQLLNIGGGVLVEDREGNPSCAVGFGTGSDPLFIPGTFENEIQSDFTISLWFRMQNNVGGDLEIMFSTQQSGPGAGGMELGVYDLNTPLFITYDPAGNIWDGDWNEEIDVVWTNTDWHHLVITHEGNTTKMYRDGVLRNQSGVDINLGGATDTGYSLNSQGFVGELDDFRLYKKALNPNEIFTLFNLEGDCYTCLD